MFAEVLDHSEVLDFHELWKSNPEMRDDIVRKLYYKMPTVIEWVTDICMLRACSFVSSHMRQMLRLYSILDTNKPRLSKKEIFEYHEIITKDLKESEIQAVIYIYFHKAVTNYYSKRKPKSQITKYVEKHIMYMFRDWFRVTTARYLKHIILEQYNEEMLYSNSTYPSVFEAGIDIITKDWTLYSELPEPGIREKSRIQRILSGETILELKKEKERYTIKQ